MSINSYGDHAEQAADALEVLIRTGETPVGEEQRTRVLAARQAVVDALHDRLPHLGQARQTDGPHVGWHLTIDNLNEEPVGVLAKAIKELPSVYTATDGQPVSPVEALGSPTTDPVVEAWRTAGQELLAAGHVLNTAESQPWLTEVDAHWQLVADTAQLVESAVVLDEGLQAAGVAFPAVTADPRGQPTMTADEVKIGRGMLAEGASMNDVRKELGRSWHTVYYTLDRPPPPMSRNDVRLLAGHLARLGSWYGDHAGIDLAFVPSAGSTTDPVRTVDSPGDVAVAQHRLRQFLATEDPWGAISTRTPRIDAQTAKIIGANQARLLDLIAERTATRPALHGLRPRLAQSMEMVTAIRQGMEGLHNTHRVVPNARAQHQQAEIAQGIRKLGGLLRFTDAQVADLVDATEQTLGTWATTVRREARRDDSQLRILVGRGAQKHPVRVGQYRPSKARTTPHRRFESTTYLDKWLRALATYRPDGEVHNPPAPDARQSLHRTLERQPLAPTPPASPGIGR